MRRINFKTLKISFSILILTALLSPLWSVASYSSGNAQTYLLSHSSNPWSTLGLVSLGANSIPSDYLKNYSFKDAIDLETPILAITSLGQNPQTFGSTDYVKELKNFYHDGQIGDPTTVNDDIFGILSLTSSALPPTDTVISGAKNFVLANQNSDGGWGYALSAGSDSNTTASAIIALTAIGISPTDSHIQNGLNYLKTAQNSDGGFTYDPASKYGTASDSSSTAWVMWALASTSSEISAWTKSGHTPADYLSTNQTSTGYFAYQNGSPEDSFSPATTAYAAIALAGKTLPLKPLSVLTQNFAFRIEGSQNTVCEGTAAGPTALDIVKNAGSQCGYTYHIKSTSGGDYLDQILTDSASGNTGWIYLVNNTEPNTGAGSYQLKTGDNILWYFGQDAWPPTQLSLSAASITSGQSGTATVQSFQNGSLSPLANATVYIGAASVTTDQNGQATLTQPDGYYKIYAQKNNFIRSNSVLLKIGQPGSSTVTLSATVPSGNGGQVSGTSTSSSISFTINTSSLDFGQITKGSKNNKQLTLNNTGNTNITISTVISGDSVFTDNFNIDNTWWKNYSTAVNSGQNKNITASLNIPQNYALSSGQKSGQLIFWARTN